MGRKLPRALLLSSLDFCVTGSPWMEQQGDCPLALARPALRQQPQCLLCRWLIPQNWQACPVLFASVLILTLPHHRLPPRHSPKPTWCCSPSRWQSFLCCSQDPAPPQGCCVMVAQGALPEWCSGISDRPMPLRMELSPAASHSVSLSSAASPGHTAAR